MSPLGHRVGRKQSSWQFNSSGFAGEGDSAVLSLIGFLDSVLRGIGQVMLQNNGYTGLLFLAGVFYSSAASGWAVLLGATVSTATAVLLEVDRSQVRDGLFGFNGALAAVALALFFEPGSLVWVYAVFAAACSTILMAAVVRLAETWKIPALTAPFVVTTLCFVMASARFSGLDPTSVLPVAALPAPAAAGGAVTSHAVVEGVLTGLAQVFFQGSAVAGLILAAGLLINSRTAFVAAILGSLGGLLVAWGLGAAEPSIRSGLFGFNSALTAIAMNGGRFAPSSASIVYGTVAVAVTAVVYAAVSGALEPLGLPALTSPFVLVVWVFLLASNMFGRLRDTSAA